MNVVWRHTPILAFCLTLIIGVGSLFVLAQIPSDTMTGGADFYAGQYQLTDWASADSQWATNGLAHYRAILRVDARDVSEWLVRGLGGPDWDTSWQVGSAHQYLVERRDGAGKRVINITLEMLPLQDMLQHAWLVLLAVFASGGVALVVAQQRPRSPITLPLMILACGSLLNLAWGVYAVPFSYVGLRWPFGMQFGLHAAASSLLIGGGLHLALTFPTPYANFALRRPVLMALYAVYPLGLLLVLAIFPQVSDKFVMALAWESQMTVAVKALAYLVWAEQYRRASVSQRGQMHWILMATTAYDLVYIVQIFSRNHELEVLQFVLAALLPISYAIAILSGRGLRLTLGATSGFIHGVANTLTLALFLCGLGLAANFLADSNRSAALPIVTVFLSVLFALTTVPLANLLREQFDSWFQGTRSAQRSLLYQFTGRVSENITLSEVTEAFYRTLDQGVQPAHTALWLWNDEAQALQRVGTSTLVAIDSDLYHLLLGLHMFTPTAQISRWQDVQAYYGLIALVASGKLVGVCAIGPRIDGRPYPGDALRFFETLTRSATLAFRNAQLVEQMEDKIIALRHAYHRFMNAQENERQRLASELHDATLQQLAHVNLLAGGMSLYLSGKGVKALEELQATLMSAERQLREILRGVHPAVLTDLGLIPALRSWLPHPDGLTVELVTDGFDERRLPDPALELTLYRLCQESVNNAVRYPTPKGGGLQLWRD